MSDKSPFTDPASTLRVLTDVVGQSIGLIKGEVALAKAELAESLSSAFSTIGNMVLAAVFAFTALNMSAVAAVAGLLALDWSLLAATSTVALALVILAVCFGVYARSQMKRAALLPQRVMRRMGKDVDVLKELVK